MHSCTHPQGNPHTIQPSATTAMQPRLHPGRNPGPLGQNQDPQTVAGWGRPPPAHPRLTLLLSWLCRKGHHLRMRLMLCMHASVFLGIAAVAILLEVVSGIVLGQSHSSVPPRCRDILLIALGATAQQLHQQQQRHGYLRWKCFGQRAKTKKPTLSTLNLR